MKKSTLENSGLETAEPLYYITNQYNFREILSGSFIGTRFSFDDKYYEDLLDLSPGRIPLVAGPIDVRLVQQVNMHDPETSFAVILEVDQSTIDRKACEILHTDINDGNSKILCLAFSGVIHLKQVTAIHFLSEKDHDEFGVRSYSNMPNPKELYRVTPDLITDLSTKSDIIQWLKSLPQVTGPLSETYTSIDRISGAVSLCIHYSKNGEQSKRFLKLIDQNSRTKKADDIPNWFKVGLQSKTKEEVLALTDIDDIVFASTITVLHKYNLNTVNQKMKLLVEIKELVYLNSLTEESRQTFEKSFSKIERLLKLEDDFEAFKSSTKHDALRGLLLFLLRPGHNELLSWNISETNASQDAMLTALAYSGIVIGRKGLETKYRPTKIDSEVSDLIVASINKLSDGKSKKEKKSVLKPAKSKPQNNTMQGTLSLPDSLPSARITSIEKMNFAALKEENFNKINHDNTALIDSAIKLSLKMGWNECLTTVISGMPKKIEIDSENKVDLIIRMKGFPIISHELNIQEFLLYFEKNKKIINSQEEPDGTLNS